ncbi:NB-ARC domain-containing protein [Lusitaniella coriacea]|uniref:NB-ARC domain-containing protein n=1 Tax=Lusitaniella coriacea TaxID=1983105 RepID=UPI003CF6D7E4
MEVNQLKTLLAASENPKLEFKSQWYCNTDQLDDKGWGEFLKDLITLANGNSGFAGQTGYLVVGASDEDPKIRQQRATFHVANNGMLANLQKLRETTLRKLRETCSPSPADIDLNFIEVEGKHLLIVEVPPPVDAVKLDRDLNTRGMRFKKGTVLIRVGQDVSVADPAEINSLRKEYQNTWIQHQRVVHNLPQPDYVNFIGRQEELEKLRNLLNPRDRIWTIVIDGIGGIGKSALALEIAHRYLNEYDFISGEERFQAIIWISAKDSVLTTDGIKKRFQVTNTLNDIYRQISVVLGEQEISHHSFNEQGFLINRALGQRRTLLLVDNLETVDDDRVNAFIRELPSPTKCIVTTRHRIDVADPIRLSAMPRKDALSLIQQECSKKSVQLDNSQIELLYKRTAGVPLAVVWSIAQISYHGSGVDKVLKRLGDARGDIARFCFENAIQHIQDKPAYKILATLALSPTPMNRNVAGVIADLSELDQDEGLVILERLSLINKKGSQFSLLPLVQEYILSKIKDFSFSDLRKLVIRFSENYAPSGADSLSAIEQYFSSEMITPLKVEVTEKIINQMWEWDEQIDEIGVSYCIYALEKLAIDTAIDAIRDVAMYSNVSTFAAWMYSAAADILSHAGRLRDLIDLSLYYQKLDSLTVESLKRFETDKVVQEIDRVLEAKKENKSEVLQQLKDRLLSSSIYASSSHPAV